MPNVARLFVDAVDASLVQTSKSSLCRTCKPLLYDTRVFFNAIDPAAVQTSSLCKTCKPLLYDNKVFINAISNALPGSGPCEACKTLPGAWYTLPRRLLILLILLLWILPPPM